MLAVIFKIYYFHDSFTLSRECCEESLAEWFLMENLDWGMPVCPTSPHSVSLFSCESMETFIRDLCCFSLSTAVPLWSQSCVSGHGKNL